LKTAAVALAMMLLAACGSGQAVRLESQRWEGTEVGVEVRPAPLRPGRAEFVVIATDADHAPANDLVVWIRMRPGDAWQQAIQDGTVGVYRRGLTLARGPQTLYVKIRRRLAETVLEYPVMVGE
jgi:hypothetical protein